MRYFMVHGDFGTILFETTSNLSKYRILRSGDGEDRVLSKKCEDKARSDWVPILNPEYFLYGKDEVPETTVFVAFL